VENHVAALRFFFVRTLHRHEFREIRQLRCRKAFHWLDTNAAFAFGKERKGSAGIGTES
jgi:hypothetical protein